MSDEASWVQMALAGLTVAMGAVTGLFYARDEKRAGQFSDFKQHVAKEYLPRSEADKRFDKVLDHMDDNKEEIKEYIRVMLGKRP